MNGQQNVLRAKPTGELTLSREDMFSVLSNGRRRFVLVYLRQQNRTVTRRELALQIAAWENDVEIEELDRKQRKRVYTALHQTHLPKMDRWGVVRYDSSRGTVELTAVADQMDVYLQRESDDREDEISFDGRELGLSVMCLLFVSGTWAGILPSVASPMGYALLVSLTFVAVTVFHAYRRRKDD